MCDAFTQHVCVPLDAYMRTYMHTYVPVFVRTIGKGVGMDAIHKRPQRHSNYEQLHVCRDQHVQANAMAATRSTHSLKETLRKAYPR
jgi:hypothetical protein